MSLVFPQNPANIPVDRPLTHALLIGVGQYPYLRGGARFANRPEMPNLGLKQLTSPPISAKEFAHWLILHLANDAAPPGSVELLLSPEEMAWSPPNGKPVAVEDATFDNIQGAFDRWYERCNAHPGNIGWFYFCGHGLEREDMYLLASDFGANPGRLWANAINLNTTAKAVKLDGRSQAACFFIDACRQAPFDLYRALTITASTLKDLLLNGGGGIADLQVLKAAVFGEQAHAPVGDVSFFTQALIRCLDGLGASSPFDGVKWRVTTDSLGEAMKMCMQRTRVRENERGFCASTPDSWRSTVIHELAGTPRVMTTIGYNPANALGFADLSLTPADGRPPIRRTPLPEPWDAEAEAGDYEVSASFKGMMYPDRSRTIRIAPPFLRCDL